MTIKMRMPLRICTLLVLGLVLITGCEYGNDFKTYHYNTADGEWFIDYPPYMRKSSYVFPGAEFQAANNYRDTYAFTREIVTSVSGKAMLDSLIGQLSSTLQDVRVESDSVYTLNETTFNTVKLTGMLRNKRLFYLVSVLEDNDDVFHFSSWMFLSKRELWEGDYKQMLHSWRR